MHKITIVWGAEASKAYSNCFDRIDLDNESAKEEMEACFDEPKIALEEMKSNIKTYSFATDEEVVAFYKGVTEANGYESFEVVPEEINEFIQNFKIE